MSLDISIQAITLEEYRKLEPTLTHPLTWAPERKSRDTWGANISERLSSNEG